MRALWRRMRPRQAELLRRQRMSRRGRPRATQLRNMPLSADEHPLASRIRAIYDEGAPRQIHPHIGGAFLLPADDSLRILAVGINSYLDAPADASPHPGWFAGWFTEQRHGFTRRLWRDLKVLAETLTAPGARFAAKRFQGMDSVFLTNAIKVYLPSSEGKRADQLTDAHFAKHLGQWHGELDAMAEAGALPHVIAIIGAPFWGRACASLSEPSAFERFAVRESRGYGGPLQHFLRSVKLEAPQGSHELLLVRVRHPAARTAIGSPRWLAGESDFHSA